MYKDIQLGVLAHQRNRRLSRMTGTVSADYAELSAGALGELTLCKVLVQFSIQVQKADVSIQVLRRQINQDSNPLLSPSTRQIFVWAPSSTHHVGARRRWRSGGRGLCGR